MYKLILFKFESAPIKMVKVLSYILLFFVCQIQTVVGNRFYAAPDGTVSGEGTITDPWDLQTALNQPAVLMPGDTLWLRGGIYNGFYISNLTGTPSEYITVIQYPNERATIQDNRQFASGATLQINGAYTIYKNFEVCNSVTDRNALGVDSFRPMGLQIEGQHINCINLIIHDTGHGIGFWSTAVNSKIYGCIIYNCGTRNIPDLYSTHGHGIYSQNNTGIKEITNNIIFNQAGFGLHLYPNPANVNGYNISGNTLFNNGILSGDTIRFNNILVNTYPPYTAENITIANNYTYDSDSTYEYTSLYQSDLFIGALDVNCGEVNMLDNYLIGKGRAGIALVNWEEVSFQNNTTYYLNNGSIGLVIPAGVSPGSYTWTNNTYFTGAFADQFSYQFGLPENFTTWQGLTGFDASSEVHAEAPTTNNIIIQPNIYEPGRAHIIAWLFDKPSTIEIDLSETGLINGQTYRIVDATNYFGSILASGVFDAANPIVSLPITSLNTQAPVGMAAFAHTAPEFITFVVLPAESPVELTVHEKEQFQLKLYPNPTENFIYLELNTTALNNIPFSIMNATGQCLLKGQLEQQTTYINVSMLPKGIYNVCIPTSNGLFTKSFNKL
jgi:hypothetical protein